MVQHTLKSAIAALALGALAFGTLAPSTAHAREMRVSSFEPPQGFYSSKVLQVWIDQANAKLSKSAQFRLYPGSILGAPPAQAELVKAGVADVALVVPTYTPGLFPLSGVVEVPGMVTSSTEGAQILNTLEAEGALAKEYADYKIIALFTTPAYRFFMTDGGVRLPADLAGKKLRTPSPFGSTLFGMLGASGVSIPAPQVYENLERGVVKGAVWVMDAYRTFRLNEVAPTITTTKFMASPMAVLMNKAAYQALSDADRAVIDEMSGKAAADWIAKVVDAADAQIEADFRAGGKVTFIEPTVEETAAWEAALAGAPAAWVAGQPDPAAAQVVLDRAAAISAGN